jgi:hypothetical protein
LIVRNLWGREDRVTPLPEPAHLRAALPNGELRVFEDTGHLPHAEHPAEVATALTEFLQSTRSRHNLPVGRACPDGHSSRQCQRSEG